MPWPRLSYQTSGPNPRAMARSLSIYAREVLELAPVWRLRKPVGAHDLPSAASVDLQYWWSLSSEPVSAALDISLRHVAAMVAAPGVAPDALRWQSALASRPLDTVAEADLAQWLGAQFALLPMGEDRPAVVLLWGSNFAGAVTISLPTLAGSVCCVGLPALKDLASAQAKRTAWSQLLAVRRVLA